jgi:hypothetical protein
VTYAEFLIKQINDEDLDWPAGQHVDLMRPLKSPFTIIDGWGTQRIAEVIQEIRQNMERVTGQNLKIVVIS